MDDQQQPTPQPPSLGDRLARAVGVRSAVAPYLAADFAAFAQRAFRIIDPARLAWSWHHDLIAEYLVLAAQRKIKRLAISIPPRGLKSKLVSVLFPAWVWITAPHESFICASWSSSLSTEMSVVRRQLLESRWYSRLWPGVVEFRGDANRQDDYTNSKGGRMLATGMFNVVGHGCNVLVVDDPLTPQQAYSELERASAIRAFNSGLRSRLNDPGNDVIVVIQQRLHRGDLIGTLQESAEAGDWTFVSLPMVESEDREIVFPVSGRTILRRKGDLLHPARWSDKWCEREAESVGPYVWSSQYLQNPSDPGQSILKAEWLSKFWVHPGTMEKPEGALVLPDTFDEIILAADLAFASTSTSDRMAIGVWGRRKAFKYLLALAWQRLDFSETVAAIRDLVSRYPGYSRIYIERAANGSAVCSALSGEIPGVVTIPATGSKASRYYAVSNQLARGEVVLPHACVYYRTPEFVAECAHAGVGGRWDDAADMLALALSQMASHGTEGAVIVAGESGFGIRELRDYLSGAEHREVDPAFGKAITDGRGLLDVTDKQVDEFLYGDLLR